MKASAAGFEKPTHQAPVENALLMRMATQYIRIASCLRMCEETLKNQRSDTHPQKRTNHDATTSIPFITPVLLSDGAQENGRLTFVYSHEYDQSGPRFRALLDRLRNHFGFARASTSCNFQTEKITIPTSLCFMVYTSTEELKDFRKLTGYSPLLPQHVPR